MPKKIKLILKKRRVDPEKEKARIRAILKGDEELAKIFLWVYYLDECCSTTEVTKAMSEYYRRPYDRTWIYRKLRFLNCLGILLVIPSHEALASQSNNPHHLTIRRKYRKLLNSMPRNLRDRIRTVYYFCVGDYGKEFIEWCLKIVPDFDIKRE